MPTQVRLTSLAPSCAEEDVICVTYNQVRKTHGGEAAEEQSAYGQGPPPTLQLGPRELADRFQESLDTRLQEYKLNLGTWGCGADSLQPEIFLVSFGERYMHCLFSDMVSLNKSGLS